MTSTGQPAQALGYLGPSGDHNDHPLAAVPVLLEAVARATGRPAALFGHDFEVTDQPALDHLEQARSSLLGYAAAVTAQLLAGHRLLGVNGRCAASIATLPRVLRAHPEAVVVWLDAHADLNLPGESPTDCDVLELGTFRTDYCEPGGLDLVALADLATAEHDLL